MAATDMTRRLAAMLAVILLLATDARAQNALDLPERPIDFRDIRGAFNPVALAVSTREDCRQLDIILADNNAQRARGLMFVTHMPKDAGMLFYYPVKSRMSMWMKNTLIPLDILFAGKDGEVVNIIENTKPLTLSSQAAKAAVHYVLELNAGMSDALGLKPGDTLYIGAH